MTGIDTSVLQFQSTLPAWGETAAVLGRFRGVIFQSTLPAWGETPAGCCVTVAVEFQSTLPAWGETKGVERLNQRGNISIHSPRVGRDACWLERDNSACPFQSTLPAWGETATPAAAPAAEQFQSTLPAWGETAEATPGATATAISIHSPRVGRDTQHDALQVVHANFNPLSPRGERPSGGSSFQSLRWYFNPLSPRGERRAGELIYASENDISIHSPRVGRDLNPMAPPKYAKPFQSTLPAWGETLSSRGGNQWIVISIHSPRVGRDLERRVIQAL